MAYVIGVDIGGTFTDTVVMDSDGSIRTFKSPTTPHDLLEGLMENVLLAARENGREPAAFLADVERIGHGTTAATNAFIERRGARVGLLTTRGFEDTIFQQRMLGMTAGLSRDQVTDYSLRQVPEPLCPPWRIHGVRERIDWRGGVVMPLVESDVRAAAHALAAEDVEALAICFLWSFKNPEHERRAASIAAEELPGVYISTSSRIAPRIGEYERMATTLVNAYLGPGIARYTDTLEERLEQSGSRARLFLLDSAGGMMTSQEAGSEPVRLLVSGPSGGLTASERLGRALGHQNVITFDMGGTSADVGLVVDGVPLRRQETEVGKYHLLLSMADITAIGAGGGSIARVEEGGYLKVGPESAGADPGPACYRRGGELPTVTDADLVLGILDPERFLGGRLKIDRDAAERALARHVADPLGISVAEAAIGIKRIVDSRMADLIRTVTLERGHDPRSFVLYAFGGAGPAHAASFALDLVDSIVVPATQSVHSALGAIASDVHVVRERSEPMRVARGEAPDSDRVLAIFAELEHEANEALADQGIEALNCRFERWVEMRYARQTKELRVPVDSVDSLYGAFERLYSRRFGSESVPRGVGYELVTFSVEGRGRLLRPELARRPSVPKGRAQLGAPREAYDPLAGAFVLHAIYDGEGLGAGDRITGPAIIEFSGTTVALPGGQVATVDDVGNITIGWGS